MRTGPHYYLRLIRASAVIASIPITLLVLFMFNQQLSFVDFLYGVGFTLLLSILFTVPYLSDVLSLTEYVNKLAVEENPEAPTLSFLSNVGELSEAVKKLHHYWESQKLELESALIESKLVFDTLPDILMMLDNNMTIIRINNAARSLFGSHLYRKRLPDIIQDERWLEAARKVVNGHSPHETCEISLPAPISRNYILTVEEFPVQENRNIRAILVLHDITESKRTEQMFADFVANASHEIRTPLTSIIGLVETIQTSAKNDPEAQETFLKIIEEQSNRLSRLVNDLLSLSKIERDLHSPPNTLVSILPIIKAVIEQNRWAAGQKSITIASSLPEELPEIKGDASQLTLVFTNILSNAIKYGKDHSTITIHADIIPTPTFNDTPLSSTDKTRLIRSRTPAKTIAIAFHDEGEGIAPEHLPRLTERFYRVDKARSQKIGGSGLGLAIVKHILNRHRAFLDVQSEIGKGSTFRVLLPIR